MGIFRHSNVMLLRTTPASDDAESVVLGIRPADGDAASDQEQRFFMLVFVDQTGAGSVKFDFLTSFGDGLWALIGTRSLNAGGTHMLLYKELQGFAPYVKVRVRAQAPGEEDPKPTFRCIVRLASTGPYRALPATVPDTIERIGTDQNDNNQFDQQGGGA